MKHASSEWRSVPGYACEVYRIVKRGGYAR
jgi:hypothetical protein